MPASSTVKKLSIAAFGAVATIGVFASATNAAVLVQYNFDAGTTSATAGLVPSTVDSNVTSNTFSGVGAIPNTGGGVTNTNYASGNPNTGLAINFQGWPTGAVDPGDYYTFTITPKAGIRMNIDNITLDERSSSTGPRNMVIRSNNNDINYNTNIGGPFTLSPVQNGTNPPNNGFSTYTTGTLGSSFTNLTQAVTFRIYGYNAGGTGGTMRLDNVTVNGTAVPEPLTMIGWGSAMVLGASLKRKFNSNKKSIVS